VSDREDLELEALRRRLDDAFETTRPRRGFEDELWLRIQTRRPLWTRVQDSLSGLFSAVREAPAVPAAAVAAVLVVLIGAGIVSLSGLGRGGAPSSTTSGVAPVYAPNTSQSGAAGFGPLPPPAPKSSVPLHGPGAASADYAGPVTLAWTGHLNLGTTSAPVFKYYEPTTVTADQFATSIGASPSAPSRPAGYLGSYAGSDFRIKVQGSIQSPALEPYFYLAPNPPAQAGVGSSPADAATASVSANSYLYGHSIAPSWPYTVTAETVGNVVKVRYLRQFSVPSFGAAPLVDATGQPYGMEVDVIGGLPSAVAGPLPVALDSATYPLISSNAAVQKALAASTTDQSGAPNSPPVVRLDTANLVYVLVVSGDHSYYEPAILFSGTFVLNGTTYTKHVLVPAVDPSQLAR
jgi:hypothetical protein